MIHILLFGHRKHKVYTYLYAQLTAIPRDNNIIKKNITLSAKFPSKIYTFNIVFLVSEDRKQTLNITVKRSVLGFQREINVQYRKRTMSAMHNGRNKKNKTRIFLNKTLLTINIVLNIYVQCHSPEASIHHCPFKGF